MNGLGRSSADAYTVQAAELRQIADAAQPLYDTLDDRQLPSQISSKIASFRPV
jgi:hypothetical protein